MIKVQVSRYCERNGLKMEGSNEPAIFHGAKKRTYEIDSQKIQELRDKVFTQALSYCKCGGRILTSMFYYTEENHETPDTTDVVT